MTVNWVTDWVRASENVIARIATDGVKYAAALRSIGELVAADTVFA